MTLLLVLILTLIATPGFANYSLTSVKDFGAVGDGQADDTAPIQSAINAALSGTLISSSAVYFPKGTYRITDMLVVARKKPDNTGYLFAEGVNLIGETSPYPDTGIPTARIVTAFAAADRAAIAIQSGRNVKIRNLEITGQNQPQLSNLAAVINLGDFLSKGVRNDPVSPHAGIVIDPFSATVPASHQYPGWAANYIGTSGGSSQTYVEGCFIRNFAVDLLTSPTNNGQGDGLVLRDDNFWLALVGVASGQSQSRAGRMEDCSGFEIGTFVSAGDYGSLAGTMPTISGGQVSGCKYLFAATDQSRGGFHCADLYAESLCSIGTIWSGSANNEPARLSGCHFSFQATQPAVDYRALIGAPVTFESCEFDTQAGGPLQFANPGGRPLFRNCQFYADVSQEKASPQLYFSDLLNASFDHCHVVGGSSDFSGHVLATTSLNGQAMVPGAMVDRTGDAAVYRVLPVLCAPHIGGSYTLDGLGGAVMAADVNQQLMTTSDLLFDVSGARVEAPGALGGSVTVPNGYLGRVVGTVNGRVLLDQVAQNAVTGHTPGISWLPRWHDPTTGDLQFPSSVINVTNPTAWSVGDHIQGIGITPGTYITAISDHSFSLSGTVHDQTGVRLYDADIRVFSGAPF